MRPQARPETAKGSRPAPRGCPRRLPGPGDDAAAPSRARRAATTDKRSSCCLPAGYVGTALRAGDVVSHLRAQTAYLLPGVSVAPATTSMLLRGIIIRWVVGVKNYVWFMFAFLFVAENARHRGLNSSKAGDEARTHDVHVGKRRRMICKALII